MHTYFSNTHSIGGRTSELFCGGNFAVVAIGSGGVSSNVGRKVCFFYKMYSFISNQLFSCSAVFTIPK